MAFLEGKTPAERNKAIVAMVLGAVALLVLGYMFLGSSSTPTTTKRNASTGTGAANAPLQTTRNATPQMTVDQIRKQKEITTPPTPVVYNPTTLAEPEVGRNIFAFYVPPPTPPRPPVVAPPTPTPTPTPPPPLLLASLAPSNVYARTGDFTLQVTGDKFTQPAHVYLGDSELPTRFVSPQQLSATVPSNLIGFEGARQVSVKTRDGQLFSNTATLNVMAPPVPNYTYVGIIGKQHYNGDTAVLKDKGKNDLLNVQRGDVLGGRFRVTSISERELVLVDTTLGIKHTLPFNRGGSNPNDPSNRNPMQTQYPQARPIEKGDEDDDTIP